MSLTPRIAAVLVLAAASPLTWSAPFNASFAALADDERGRSLDVDAAWQPTDWLTLAGGLGSTSSRSAAGDLDGTSLRALAEVNSERAGLRGYYWSWSSNDLDSDTLGARVLFRTDGLTLSLIGEVRGLDLDYTVSGTNPQRGSAQFSASGWGAGASYHWAQWSLVAEGISYHYGALSRYVPTQSATDKIAKRCGLL